MTTPSPDWVKRFDEIFTSDTGLLRDSDKVVAGLKQFISDLLVEEKRKAQDEILAPLNMVCVGDNWLSIQAYKDLLASLTHNI